MSNRPPPGPLPGSARRKGRARERRVVGLLLVFTMLSQADKLVLGLAADPIMRDLGLTKAQFGLVGSAFFGCFSLGAVVIGYLGNRASMRWMLGGLALAWCLATAPIAVAPTLGVLLAGRSLLGLVEGPTAPLAAHTVHTWFPDDRRSLPTSVVQMGSALGIALSAPILAAVISGPGWQWAFGALAVLSAAWAVCWLLIGGQGAYGASDVPATERPARRQAPYRRIFGSRTFWGALLFACPGMATVATSTVWLARYLSAVDGTSGVAAGLMIGAVALLTAGTMLVLGALNTRLIRRGASRWAHGGLGGLVAAVGGVLVIISQLGHGSGTAALLVIGIALANSSIPLAIVSLSRICSPAQRAGVLATYHSVAGLLGALAVYLFGLVAAHIAGTGGLRTGFALLGACCLLGGLLGGLLCAPDRDAAALGLTPQPIPLPERQVS